jgi:hypothetical protein
MKFIFAFVMGTIMAAIAVPTAADPADQPFVRNDHLGTGVHFGGDATGAWDRDRGAIIKLIASSGLGWVRTGTNWQEIEPIKGSYQIPRNMFDELDAEHRAGLKVDLLFDGPNTLYADNFDPQAYGAAAAYLAKTLAGRIDAIEILNEPNNFGVRKFYGNGSWNGYEADGTASLWIKKYVLILNAAAKAIKAVNPTIKVIGLGSPAPANFRQIAMGLAPEVDGITDHPYSNSTVPEILPFPAVPEIIKRDGIAVADKRGSFESMMRMYREQCAKYAGPKEIWLTEFGYSTFQKDKSSASNMFSPFTESAQAKYLVRRMLACLGMGINHAFQYDFKDDGTDPHNPENNFGLVHHDLSPKPSYYALQRLIKVMDGYEPKQNFEVNVYTVDDRLDTWPITWDGGKIAAPGTIATYQFSNNQGDAMVALWSQEHADGDLQPRYADVELVTDASVASITGYDLWTEKSFPIQFEKKGKRIEISGVTIPDYPILLTIKSS